MKKAKYIGRYSDRYDRDSVSLEYEYRNEIYTVHVHNTKGNEPLAWQHANAQAKIDHEIELKEKYKQIDKSKVESVEDSLDYFFKLIDSE